MEIGRLEPLRRKILTAFVHRESDPCLLFFLCARESVVR